MKILFQITFFSICQLLKMGSFLFEKKIAFKAFDLF